MMTVEERKEKNEFKSKLCNLLTEGHNDEKFFKTLIWASQEITTCLTSFQDIFEEND